jgi:hypothetical protein
MNSRFGHILIAVLIGFSCLCALVSLEYPDLSKRKFLGIDWPFWFLITISGLVSIAFWLRDRSVIKRRRRWFAYREEIPFENWFVTYYGNTSLPREKVKQVLDAIGESLAVQPTRLRPEDLTEKELSIHEIEKGDNVESCYEELFALLKSNYHRPFRWDDSWKTLDDIITGTIIQMDATGDE